MQATVVAESEFICPPCRTFVMLPPISGGAVARADGEATGRKKESTVELQSSWRVFLFSTEVVYCTVLSTVRLIRY